MSGSIMVMRLLHCTINLRVSGDLYENWVALIMPQSVQGPFPPSSNTSTEGRASRMRWLKFNAVFR